MTDNISYLRNLSHELLSTLENEKKSSDQREKAEMIFLALCAGWNKGYDYGYQKGSES